MPQTYQEQLSAPELGQKMIELELSQETLNPLEGSPVTVLCDYSQALPNGVTLPISIQVTTPDGRRIVDRVISRVLPESFDFIPDVGGVHLARVIEVDHNRWFGSMQISVTGDDQEESDS